MERLKPFEAEVKEKSALLGKTRHEGNSLLAMIADDTSCHTERTFNKSTPTSETSISIIFGRQASDDKLPPAIPLSTARRYKTL